jgi:hypothetical protein
MTNKGPVTDERETAEWRWIPACAGMTKRPPVDGACTNNGKRLASAAPSAIKVGTKKNRLRRRGEACS